MPKTVHEATPQWAVYEANVQAYRTLSLAMQAILLAVGAILLDKDLAAVTVTTLGVIAFILSWIVLFPVVFSRSAISDYYKFGLGDLFNAKGERSTDANEPRLSERDYADFRQGGELRRGVYAELTEPDAKEPFRTVRQTRFKLDIVVPIFLTFVWALFVVLAFFG